MEPNLFRNFINVCGQIFFSWSIHMRKSYIYHPEVLSDISTREKKNGAFNSHINVNLCRQLTVEGGSIYMICCNFSLWNF